MAQKIARLLTLVSLGCLPLQLYALGLGDVETNSALNEKLSAKISILSARPGELGALHVSLADAATFQRAGIERTVSLTKLQFKVIATSDTQGYIEVTSPENIREPFLDFLIEINWPSGHLVREYTMLLDPPLVLQAAPSSTKSQVPVVSEPTSAPVKPAPMPAPTPVASVAPKPSTGVSSAPLPSPAEPERPQPAATEAAPSAPVSASDYGPVRQGDTLYGIATQMRQSGAVSLEQLMIAMLQSNPDAFIDNNVNMLKQGKVLRAPTQQELDAIEPSAALKEVQRQVALWKEYQANAQQREVPSSVTGQEAAPLEAPQSEDKTVVAKLVETKKEEAPKTDAELRLVGADQSAGGAGTGQGEAKAIAKLQDDLAMASESADAARKESQELRDRVGALEEQLNQMRGVLQLKDQELASLQQSAARDQQAAEQAASAGKAAAFEVEKDVAKAEQQDAVQVAEPPPVAPAEQAEKEVPKPVVAPPPATSAPAPTSTPAAEENAPEELELLSSLDDLMSDYGATTAIAIFVLMLLIIAIAIRKRRKSDGPESILADQGSKPVTRASAAAAAPSARVAPTVTPSVQHDTSFLDEFDVSEMAHMQADVSEADPLAEADVFLAYGRYQQAEDLIREAISQEPDRSDYRLKLMEVYRAANNRTGFLNEAESLYATLAGTGDPLWNKAFFLGKEFCPDVPLFQGEAEPVVEPQPANSFVVADLSEAELTQELQQSFGAAPKKSSLLPHRIEEHELDQLWPRAGVTPAPRATVVQPAPVVAAAPAAPDYAPMAVEEPGIAPEPMLEPDQDEMAADDLNMDIDINLDESSLEEEMSSFTQGTNGSSTDLNSAEIDSDGIDSLMPDIDEVGTKLDLAKAYIDMGDMEGAQSILSEVMEEGNEAQKKEAHQLLGQI